MPVVWGGYDPTVNAAHCLSLCDYACVGEGDQTILEIAERIDLGRGFDDVCNLAYLRDGRTVFNPKSPVEEEIDKYPWRDNTPDRKYFIEDNQVVENYPVINDREPGSYQTMSARGCPYMDRRPPERLGLSLRQALKLALPVEALHKVF